MVVPDRPMPTFRRKLPATAAPGRRAPQAPAAAASTASAAPVKAEGWGTLKGQVVFGGTPPPPKVLQAKGKAEKDPDGVRVKDAPIVSERLVVDAANKGVKNVLVYLPGRPRSTKTPRRRRLAKTVEFDQKNCVFSPTSWA